MRRLLFRLVPIVIAAMVLVWKFATAESFANPETGRKGHVALSREQEQSLGLQAYQQVLSQSQAIASGPEVDEVQRVVARLEGAVGDAGVDPEKALLSL